MHQGMIKGAQSLLADPRGVNWLLKLNRLGIYHESQPIVEVVVVTLASL